MNTLDPGHLYELAILDGHGLGVEKLRFVKREGPGYPGNEGHHAGTTTQEVLRVLIDRMKYERAQTLVAGDRLSAGFDWCVIKHLREAMWLLEERAAHRGSRPWPCVGSDAPAIELIPVCEGCGHIGCEGRACGR